MLFAALALPLLHADTITFKDHSSVNGTLVRMANEEIAIKAHFTRGKSNCRR